MADAADVNGEQAELPASAETAASPAEATAGDGSTPPIARTAAPDEHAGTGHEEAQQESAPSQRPPSSAEWSEEEKNFRTHYLDLASEVDKQLAFANTTALRTVAQEKRLWLKDRKELNLAIGHLEKARAASDNLYKFLEGKGRLALVLDENGVYKKKGPFEEMEARLAVLRGLAVSREEGDQSALLAQDLVIEVSKMPGLWKPWEPPLPASLFLNKLAEARRLCNTSRAEYKKIKLLESQYPSELSDMHNGRRIMGVNTLEMVVIPQLCHEEQKALHRQCGDQFLHDVDMALRSKLDPMLTSEYCQKLFTAIDVDGSGAIDAEELRQALIQLKVFLTDEEAAGIVTELDVDRNGTIERAEWERGIVMQKYKVYLLLSMSNRNLQDAEDEFKLAGASDRNPLLLQYKARIDKMTPVSVRERMLGALWGILSGDALGMPTDGSINCRAIARDYGLVDTFTDPLKTTHADGGMHLGINAKFAHIGSQASILYPATVLEPARKSNIMFGVDRFHKQRGVHPHRNLRAGRNTLNADIAKILARSLVKSRNFDKDDYLEAYIQYMLTNKDKDMFIDKYHIEFFERFAQGNKAYYSAGLGLGASEHTARAMLQITPLITFYSMQEELRDRAVLLGQGEYSYANLRYSSKHSAPMVLEGCIADIVHQYIELFFRSETLQMYCLKWSYLLKKLLLGYNPLEELKEAARKENVDLPVLLPLPDEEVVGIVYNSYDPSLDSCLPCVLYLCIKYHDSPARAMTASANLGGDTANRTALVGALMGAIHGYTEIPLEWRVEVQDHESLGIVFEDLVLQAMQMKL